MSIELRKKQEENKSSSFSIDVAMPNIRQKSTAIKIDVKNTKIEKPKEKKIAKKKPEKKIFYELLEESWHKGILNRSHTATDSPDNEKCYYCPICCVCEILEIIPKIRKDNARLVRNPYSHGEMVNLLREKCNFIDHRVSVKPGIDSGIWSDDYQYSEQNEPMLAFSLASSLSGQMNNLQIAHAIKEQLYDKKQLPKEEQLKPLGNEDLFEIRPMYGYATARGILTRRTTTQIFPGLGIKDLKLDED